MARGRVLMDLRTLRKLNWSSFTLCLHPSSGQVAFLDIWDWVPMEQSVTDGFVEVLQDAGLNGLRTMVFSVSTDGVSRVYDIMYSGIVLKQHQLVTVGVSLVDRMRRISYECDVPNCETFSHSVAKRLESYL